MPDRAPDKHDNTEGWSDVPHTGQKTSSTSAQYAPKRKGKNVAASGFTQPGTPTEERRQETDMKWLLDGDRSSATVGNAVAENHRDGAGIDTKDWAKRRQ